MTDEEDLNKLFDKSKATKVPKHFPGDVNGITLELEDVLEEVTDEIDNKALTKIENDQLCQTISHIDRYHTHINKAEERLVSNVNRNGFHAEIEEKKQFFKKPQHEVSHIGSPGKQGLTEVERKISEGKEEQEEGVFDGENGREILQEEDINQNGESTQAPVLVSIKSAEANDEDDSKETNTNIQENEVNINNGTTAKDEAAYRMWNGKPIDLETAKALRLILFGTTSSSFDQVWRKQTITLNKQNHYALRYHKGPAEGVMACIQSFVLKHVLFDEIQNDANTSCVTSALTDILWQAGQSKAAVVCLPTGKDAWIFGVDFKEDGLIEKLEVFEFAHKDDLQEFIRCNMNFFENPEKSGCILFIYSVILTRSIDSIMEDLGSSNAYLIGPDGICNQSLINLMIVGIATPHVFNGSREFTDQNGKMTLHCGLSKRSQIGFLSHEEAENPKKLSVGSMLKTPVFPIWVISCNNHICVLFCKKRNLLSDWKLERRFDLFCFGGISRHFSLLEEDIRLTIDTIQNFDPDDPECELNSCLENTIRTKWQDCVINWNGNHRF